MCSLKRTMFRQVMFGQAGMRVALLALAGTALAMPMVAQDNTAPPPPHAQDGGPGSMRHGGPGGHGGRGEMKERRLEMMTKELNLTPDQVTQVKAITVDSDKQMVALRDDTSTPKADKREKMMAIRQDSMTKVRAILTDDQKRKMDAMQARMREHRQERKDGQGVPPPLTPQ